MIEPSEFNELVQALIESVRRFNDFSRYKEKRDSLIAAYGEMYLAYRLERDGEDDR